MLRNCRLLSSSSEVVVGKRHSHGRSDHKPSDAGSTSIQTGSNSVRLSVKEIALLIFLAEEGPQLRETISQLLWRGNPATARHSLSQAIYSIRRKLGQSSITGDANRIALDRISTDLEEFRVSINGRIGDPPPSFSAVKLEVA